MNPQESENADLDIAKEISQCRNAIAHPAHQCLLTCYIPPSRVGAIIGRRGNTILQIQREALKKSWGPIRLSVVSGSNNGNEHHPSHTVDDDIDSRNTNTEKGENTFDESSLWTPILIRGDPIGCFTAAKLLIPLLCPGFPNESEYDLSSELDDVVLDIPIHRSKHSAIIGKKGLTIATLSADNNVRIMVPHRNMERTSSTNINIVQLEGDLFNVEKCLAQMLKAVCSPPPNYASLNTDPSNEKIEELLATGDGPNITIEVTSKKDSKFSEKTITVPSELYHLVPSLGRIRIIGKSTNTVIRRKKMAESSDEVEEDDTEESEESKPVSKGKKVDIPCTTLLIISGKARPVDNATLQLQKIFLKIPESDEDKDRSESDSKSEDRQGRRGGRGRNRQGRGRGRGRGKASRKIESAETSQ